jgi:ubiquinone/menaquinone biosynthesis C-methylase UbiE
MNHPWQIKCLIDTAKAVLPFQEPLRRLKDRILGYQREPNRETSTIRDGLILIEWLGTVKGAKVLEIGAGWQPMIPILLSLAGAEVYMADLHRLIRHETFCSALDAIRQNRDEISERLRLTPDAVDCATRECQDMEGRFRELGLTYLAPCDCRHLELKTGSIDIVTSRAVLEHIPPAVIADIFIEASRVLRPAGIMLHEVDHSDHWSHHDRTISAVNFLRYPDWLFRLTCINPQNYQNRLRHSEYLAMLKSTGFLVKRELRTVNPACVGILSEMRVAARFQHFSPEDLATTCSILLATSIDRLEEKTGAAHTA